MPAPASLRFNVHKTGPDFSATSENLPPANGHSSEGIPQAAAQRCLHNRARLKQGKGTEAPPPASTRDPRLAKGCPIRASPTTSTRHAMRVSGIFADHDVSAIFPHHYHFSIDRRHVISMTRDALSCNAYTPHLGHTVHRWRKGTLVLRVRGCGLRQPGGLAARV